MAKKRAVKTKRRNPKSFDEMIRRAVELQRMWIGSGSLDLDRIRASMLQDLRYRKGKPQFAAVVREIRGQLVELGKIKKALGKKANPAGAGFVDASGTFHPVRKPDLKQYPGLRKGGYKYSRDRAGESGAIRGAKSRAVAWGKLGKGGKVKAKGKGRKNPAGIFIPASKVRTARLLLKSLGYGASNIDISKSATSPGAMKQFGVWDTDVLTALAVRLGMEPLSGGHSRGTHEIVKFWGKKVTGKRTSPTQRTTNPEPGADAMYQKFHGTAPSRTFEFTESIHEHNHLAALGTLHEIKIATMSGIIALEFERDRPILTADENGRQLFITGGDQKIDIKALGLTGKYWKELVLIGLITEITYETRKTMHNNRLTQYYHKLGEDTLDSMGSRSPHLFIHPCLLYDTVNQRLSIAGGTYKITARGIED